MLQKEKTYTATIELGKISNTYDSDGIVNEIKVSQPPTKKEIVEILQTFEGSIQQTPPSFSAIKINGQRAYDLAREGKKIVMPSRTVEIFSIQMLSYQFPLLTIEVHCSSGTYIRSLAHDIGEKLQTGGIITELIRTKLGENITLDQSIDLTTITSKNIEQYILPVEKIEKILALPSMEIFEKDIPYFKNGNQISLPYSDASFQISTKNKNNNLIVCKFNNTIIGIGEINFSNMFIQPKKVLI